MVIDEARGLYVREGRFDQIGSFSTQLVLQLFRPVSESAAGVL
jgi:hypothetical protein